MSDDLAREHFVTVTIDGADHKLWELTAYDRAEVLRRFKAEQRAAILANCKDAGLDKDQTFVELKEFDAKRFGEGDFVERVNALEGRLHVLEIALRREHADKALDLARRIVLSPLEMLGVVCQLCNLRPESEDESQQQEEQTENPPETAAA